MSDPFNPDVIEEPALRELYDYWAEKCGSRAIPARGDIDPLDIPKLLPQIYMIDVERDPMRFRFRLIGTTIITWFGRDATGLYMDEPEYKKSVHVFEPHYVEVVETGRPRYDHQHAPQFDARYRNYARLLCPLAGDGKTVDMMLCGLELRGV